MPLERQDGGTRPSVLDRLMGALGALQPYPWQTAAFEAMCGGTVPAAVAAPTAAGKTALMVCWLAALITQARASDGDARRITLPRRYVVVVNRRVLVDAASDLALELVEALRRPELADLRATLAGLSLTGQTGTGEPLTVSTLRGQRADACDWATDPSRPAIIAATPDMAGSRLLFGGYGLGRSRRATHAGLLGVDTLVVHDEAHLAPALTALLRRVEALAAPGADRIGRPALSVLEMSATPRDLPAGVRPVITATPDQDAALAQRLRAVKRLIRQDGAGLPELVKQAVAAVRAGQAVLVALNAPEDAAKAAAALVKAGLAADRVACLTGTLRGLERDQLAESPVLRRLAGTGVRDTAGGGAVLVATAAGEVGIDLDAEVLLCDAVTLDRLMQRAGRCNRRGIGTGHIVVFPDLAKTPKALAAQVDVALALLDALPSLPPLADGTEAGRTARDASPQALTALLQHPRYAEAIEPAPEMRALAREVVDLYALTSAPLAVPQRALYLHGVQDAESEVRLAWRHLPTRAGDGASGRAELVEWLEAWPVSVREQARLPGYRVEKLVLARLAAWTGSGPAALLVSADGERVEPLAGGLRRIALRGGDLVVLAAEAGGLNAAGLPDALASEVVADVSGAHTDARGYARGALSTVEVARKVSEARGERWTVVAEDEEDAEDTDTVEHPSLAAALGSAFPGWRIAWHDHPPAEADGQPWRGHLRVWPERPGVRAADDGDSAGQARVDRSLDDHLQLAGRAAARLLAVLPLAADCRHAVHQGASDHDDGKAAPRWQAAIGRRAGEVPLAKSARPWFDARRSAGYRHELGSVAAAPAEWRTASDRALWRHLVVAHHGWARPAFSAAARVHPGCADAARQAAEDFGRLHDTLGPWALAYLEALLKAADIQAELLAEVLASEAGTAAAVGAATWPTGPALPAPAARCWRVAVNVRNPGEYFACLGVAALVRALQPETVLALRWEPGHFVLQGVDEAAVHACLRRFVYAEVIPASCRAAPPEEAQGSKANKWPDVWLNIRDTRRMALHFWMDDQASDKSEWKFCAGNSTSQDIVRRILVAARLLLESQHFRVNDLFNYGSGTLKISGPPARLRLDASSAWTAVEAGFSLQDTPELKSSRPWVELLAAIGIQNFCPPPAGGEGEKYFTWTGSLPYLTAMAASRGVNSSCDSEYTVQTRRSGENKDALLSCVRILSTHMHGVFLT